VVLQLVLEGQGEALGREQALASGLQKIVTLVLLLWMMYHQTAAFSHTHARPLVPPTA